MSVIRQELQQLISQIQETKDVTVLDIIKGKPGLDLEKGKYRVDGGLIIDKVQYRATTGRNIVKTVGLVLTRINHLEDGSIEDLDTLYVTKEEALDLISQHGSVNSYIKTTVNKKREASHYLQPYPAISESFTQDDRLVHVYEVDEEGSKVRPHKLMIDEQSCSFMMWELLHHDFKVRKQRDAKVFRGESAENVERIKQIKLDIRTRRLSPVNPFRK